MKYICILFLFFFSTPCFSTEKTVTVSYVIDGDTFKTTENETVRLLGINTPEIAHHNKNKSQPFSHKAKRFLTEKIAHQTVHLHFSSGRLKDKYGRFLAFVYLGEENINLSLLKEGLAHIYTFPDTPFNILPFFKAEEDARTLKKNIWSTQRWHVLNTNIPVEKKRIGTFNIMQGTVLKSTQVKNKTYLNFGKNWQTDFTVEIPQRFIKNFEEKGIQPHTFYAQKQVRVRGFLKPINGTLITVSHPEQIEVVVH